MLPLAYNFHTSWRCYTRKKEIKANNKYFTILLPATTIDDGDECIFRHFALA